MPTLLLPDLHHRTHLADAIAAHEPADRVIVMGDCQDDFDDGPLLADRTARWMRRRIEQGWELLLGNHDLPYGFWHDQHWCPGYTRAKARAINAVLSRDHWLTMRLWTFAGPWLVSHAGIYPALLPTQDTTPDALERLHLEVTTLLHHGGTHPLLQPGRDRGFENPHGGVLWMDWDELIPIDGLHQVVGHTPSLSVRQKSIPHRSMNACLDTNTTCYAVVEDSGALTIKLAHPANALGTPLHHLAPPP